MTVPCFRHQEFVDYLKEKGCEVLSSDFFDKYNRIIVKVNGQTFPLQYNETYFYPIVVKTCEMIGIPAPEDFQKCYDQHIKQRQKIEAETASKNNKSEGE